MVMEMIEAISAAILEAITGDHYFSLASESGIGSGVRSAFRWGASLSVMLLLIFNQLGRRSSLQASLLALFLLMSLPAAFYQLLRGQFGRWVAFLVIAVNYCFSTIFPVSRILPFVVIPDWLAYELRDTTFGAVLCLVIFMLLVVMEIRGSGGSGNCECNYQCSGYWLSMLLLLLFTVLYLCLGPWQ